MPGRLHPELPTFREFGGQAVAGLLAQVSRRQQVSQTCQGPAKDGWLRLSAKAESTFSVTAALGTQACLHLQAAVE
jgi:hypothetical protein